MTKLRGYLALGVLLLSFLLLDLVQRLFVAPWARAAPARRIRVLSHWQRFVALWVLGCLRTIGGARIQGVPRIQGREGVLILMNHQSVLDIPLVVAAVHDAYPRILTRKRYVRHIPLISHMVRLYQYPVVDPSANPGETRRMLASIREVGRTADVPLVIFPEGTRTVDGEVGPFRTAGLKIILRQRTWTVYVLVADGFWERAKMKHFLAGLGGIRGRLVLLGPFEWQDPRGDAEAFAEAMRGHMVEALAAMRHAVPA